jgi:hypothetical protein
VRDDDGSGDFTGVNPGAMADLVGSVNSSGNAQPVVNRWMSRAAACGIDTSRLTAISRSLAWAQDQLPMLRRRLGMAQAYASQHPDMAGGGLVPAGGESLGNFPDDAAAQRAGAQDARDFKDGKLTAADLYQKMAANPGDAAYDTALMQALGADGVWQLEHYPPYDPGDPKGHNARRVLAQAVAAAMANGVTFPVPGFDPGSGGPGREDPALLAPLLADAAFPPRVLADLGTSCLQPGEYKYGNQVWQALAASPAGATMFVHDNISVLPQWMAADPNHHGGLPDGQAAGFAAVISAGTIGGPGADQNIAAQNTTGLVQYYATHPGSHTHVQIQGAFDQIVAHYWDDVRHSVTDPAPTDLGSGHVTVSADQWQAFISEGMRNATAGASLLAYAGQQAYQLKAENPHDAGALHAAGVLEGFFSQTALNTYQQMKSEGDSGAGAWKSGFTAQLNTALGTGVDVVLKPLDAATTITKAGIKDVINLVADHFVPDGKPPPPPKPDVIGWRTDWTDGAATVYQQDHNIGDPQQYAKVYCGGKSFLDDTGHLVDGATAEMKEAYNQWLQDEALASAIASDKPFTGADLGRHDGEEMAGK